MKSGDKEPPQILEPLKSVVIEEGESVVMSTQVVGNPTPKVTWLKNGKPVKDLPTRKDGDTYILTLHETTPEDAAQYTVSAKNPVGSAETTATLVVEGKFIPSSSCQTECVLLILTQFYIPNYIYKLTVIIIMAEGAFKILTGKPTGKRPLGRSRRRWEDKIRIHLKEIGSIRGIGLILTRIGIIGEPL